MPSKRKTKPSFSPPQAAKRKRLAATELLAATALPKRPAGSALAQRARSTRARSSSGPSKTSACEPSPQKEMKDLHEVTSAEESEDELQQQKPHPAAATPNLVRRQKRAPTVTYKTPSRRRVVRGEGIGEEEDELAAADPVAVAVAVGGMTPTTRSRGVAVAGEAVTPKTIARDLKPPRTKKKGTSARPRTKTHAKMGIGVPGDVGMTTPSAGKRGGEANPVSCMKGEDAKHRKNMGGGEGEGGVKAPASVTSMVKKWPSMGRLSLGTEGLEDPFAVPKDAMEVGEEDEVVASAITFTGASRTLAKGRTPKKASPRAPVGTAESKKLWKDIKVSADSIVALRKHVLGKAMGRQCLNLVGLDEEYSNVHHLLEQTITAGEGNSMLIIGARGSGKTTIVETAISSLSSSHSGEFHVVRLNGLLQTDDKTSLREIWRQLGVEMDLDENDQPKTTNFADTLQSILAVLSHPDELQTHDEAADPNGDPDVVRTATAVVFVLDEFDRFALHPRQTLLYNLFDIAQAKKAPIAVLGLTCKVDVVDSLEKRVKSRFSHRTVHLKLPATLDAFWEVVKEGLSGDMGNDAVLADANTEQYFEAWNQHLDELRQTPAFATLLRRTFASSKTVAPIFNAFILPLSLLTPNAPFPNTLVPLAPPPSNLHLLPSLSDLQLALLIAAARLEVLADTETVNFEMVYDEYLKLCTKTRVQSTPSGGMGKVWSKSVAVGGWEGLEGMGLVVPVDVGRKGMWRVDVGLMEIREGVRGTVWAKWCREVV